MAETTGIEWTDSTFNPWRGCTKVSRGCEHCYAETLSGRNPYVLGVWGPRGTRVLAARPSWNSPREWNRKARKAGKRHRVFCSSLADVFEDWPHGMVSSNGQPLHLWDDGDARMSAGSVTAPFPRYLMRDARKRLFGLIRETPWLDWLLLTKRPENVRSMMPPGDWPNVWLGVSVEDQDNIWRVDCLLEQALEAIRVPVRFVSAEPLLGPLNFGSALGLDGINWVIVGGESGGKARPLHIDWVYHILDQCRAAGGRLGGAAFFNKQLGAAPMGNADDDDGRSYLFHLPILDSKGGNIDEFPEALRIREYPSIEEYCPDQ